MVMSWFFFPII